MALLAGLSAAWAQGDDAGDGIPLSESPVPGIYQLFGIGPDGAQGEAMPFLKIYNADGTFCTVLAVPERTQPGMLTNSGSYRVVSERQLVESLAESVYESHRAGDDNTMDYAVEEGVMWLTFPSGGGVGREAWHVVGRPVAAGKAGRTPARAKALAEALEGVWQLCYNTDEGRRVYAPIYKIYRADGTFSTVSFVSQAGTARISAQGSYAVRGPEEYVERISESAVAPELVGEETSLGCIFTDDCGTYMRVSFTLPDGGDAVTEEWARVTCAGRER